MSKIFTKDDLKTGMFGVMTNGLRFVVVNDTLVYDGSTCNGYDFKALKYCSYEVDRVFDNCDSFGQLKLALDGESMTCRLVYDRNALIEMTISEIEEKLGIKGLKVIGEDK